MLDLGLYDAYFDDAITGQRAHQGGASHHVAVLVILGNLGRNGKSLLHGEFLPHKLADNGLEFIVAESGDAFKFDIPNHQLDLSRLHNFATFELGNHRSIGGTGRRGGHLRWFLLFLCHFLRRFRFRRAGCCLLGALDGGWRYRLIRSVDGIVNTGACSDECQESEEFFHRSEVCAARTKHASCQKA